MTAHGFPGRDFGAIINTGSGPQNVGSVIGQQNNYAGGGSGPVREHGQPEPARPRADIGVITVLHQEMRAVVRLFERAGAHQTRQLHNGAQAHESVFPVAGGVLRAAALQALQPGNHSAIEAYHRLREHFAPPIVLLVGIAGAIALTDPDDPITVGDVVISDEVIHYDARREAPDGVHRRGQSHLAAPVLRNRLNEFFRVHGGRMQATDGAWFRVRRGPIGSGGAVITDRDSDIRRWLHEVHEKTQAVETEAAGFAQACYEDVQRGSALHGWLVIRGISDLADPAKGHADHDLASERAALVLERLLPYLAVAASAA